MAESMALAQQGPGCVSPLFGDDTLEILADQKQLEEMDNEIYEPLKQFDGDLRDLMMDCITEKVRRILSLDPSKYKNGRLPFGLKPDKAGLKFRKRSSRQGVILKPEVNEEDVERCYSFMLLLFRSIDLQSRTLKSLSSQLCCQLWDQEELERLRDMIERLKEENESLNRQLEAARALAERWKHKFNELRDSQVDPPKARRSILLHLSIVP